MGNPLAYFVAALLQFFVSLNEPDVAKLQTQILRAEFILTFTGVFKKLFIMEIKIDIDIKIFVLLFLTNKNVTFKISKN